MTVDEWKERRKKEDKTVQQEVSKEEKKEMDSDQAYTISSEGLHQGSLSNFQTATIQRQIAILCLPFVTQYLVGLITRFTLFKRQYVRICTIESTYQTYNNNCFDNGRGSYVSLLSV